MSKLIMQESPKLAILIRRAKVVILELACRLRLMKRPKSKTIIHAERELLAAGYEPLDKEQEDGPNKWIQQNVLELLEVFGRQGHSGFSAPFAVEMFRKLALHEPLVPLSGADDEWNDIGDGMFQNNRCSRVFKDADGRAYDIDGRVFRYPNGCCYTGRDSRVYVTFPYTPTKEYVDVDR